MKLYVTSLPRPPDAAQIASRPRTATGGFAVLGVFVILTLMVVFVTTNTIVLNQLHREIRLIEQRQLQKFGPKPAQPAAYTNATAATLIIQAE